MTAHFFVAPSDVQGDLATLDEDDTHHLATVLRARAGLPASVADGSGTVWSGTFAGLHEGRAQIHLTTSVDVALERPRITVVHALPKQRKLDEVVQRLTELGVHRIIPVTSVRSQVDFDDRRAAKAVARWRAIATAAAKQSRRARLPIIDDIGTWEAALDGVASGVVAWEESDSGLRSVLDGVAAADDVVVGIGPEGGLDADEVARTGLPHASLGRTVLRTETAAIVAVAAVRFHYGLMETR